MRPLLELTEIYRAAAQADLTLDPPDAAQILQGFDALMQKQYGNLEDAASAILAALGPLDTMYILRMDGDQGGFKLDVGYPAYPAPKQVTNARLGVAWKRFDDKYRVIAHLLDAQGNRVTDPEAFAPSKPVRRKPEGWPGEGESFTFDPDLYLKD